MLSTLSWPVIDRIPLVGDYALSPHGLFIAVGFLFGAWWLLREGVRRGIALDDLNNAIILALVGAVIGARVFYVIGHFGEFSGDPLSMFEIWRGGITLLGGIAGAFIACVPLMRRRGIRFFQGADAAAVGMAFGLAVGRLGDLIIGDHLGTPTNFFLGWGYESGQLSGFECVPAAGSCVAEMAGGATLTLTPGSATLAEGGQVIAAAAGVHQTALYDMIGVSALFILLYWMNRRNIREGVLFCTFLLWYGAERIITDFLRIDKTIFGLTGSQWTSIGAVLVAAYFLLRWSGERRRIGPIDPRPSTSFIPPREPAPPRRG